MRWFFWIWTFPISLGALLNRKERLEDFQGRRVYTYRIWFRGYATAFWPHILVPRSRNRLNVELMHHENRHLQQQMVLGPFFLPLYLVCSGVLVIFGPRRAHRWNPFEIEARAYAKKKMRKP